MFIKRVWVMLLVLLSTSLAIRFGLCNPRWVNLVHTHTFFRSTIVWPLRARNVWRVSVEV